MFTRAMLLFYAIFIGWNAQAQELLHPLKPLEHAVRYGVVWSGIHVADLIVEAEETPGRYRMRAVIDTFGIANVAGQFASDNAVRGTMNPQEVFPREYVTRFNMRKQSRTITIRYDAAGKLLGETAEPPENREKRPEVPLNLKESAIDPLTAVYMVRARVQEAVIKGQQHFTVPMFDGRRRSDLEFTVEGVKTMNVRGRPMPVVVVWFTRKAVAGYTANEIRDLAKKEPRITLYLSTDGRLIPIYAEGTALLGKAQGYLEQECATLTECRNLKKR